MIGLLRYAFLKNSRDGSLLTYLLAPTVMLVAPMLVIWLFDGSTRYRMPPDAAGELTIFISTLMSALAGFMLFRTEIANHSIGSFVLASRPWAIPLSSAIYGCLVGVGAALGLTAAFALSGIRAGDPGASLIRIVIFTFTAAAGGAMAVVLSRSMAALVWIYGGILVLIGFETSAETDALRMVIAVAISLICVSLSAVLLERRCAV